MRRREFITRLSSAAAAVAWPLPAHTQPSELPPVGFLHVGNERPRAVASYQKGLAEGGYIADRNVALDFRWADEQFLQFWSILVSGEIPGALSRNSGFVAVALQLDPAADVTRFTGFTGRIVINPHGTRALYPGIGSLQCIG